MQNKKIERHLIELRQLTEKAKQSLDAKDLIKAKELLQIIQAATMVKMRIRLHSIWRECDWDLVAKSTKSKGARAQLLGHKLRGIRDGATVDLIHNYKACKLWSDVGEVDINTPWDEAMYYDDVLARLFGAEITFDADPKFAMALLNDWRYQPGFKSDTLRELDKEGCLEIQAFGPEFGIVASLSSGTTCPDIDINIHNIKNRLQFNAVKDCIDVFEIDVNDYDLLEHDTALLGTVADIPDLGIAFIQKHIMSNVWQVWHDCSETEVCYNRNKTWRYDKPWWHK